MLSLRSGEPTEDSILRGIHKVFAYLQQENLLKEEIVVQDEIDIYTLLSMDLPCMS